MSILTRLRESKNIGRGAFLLDDYLREVGFAREIVTEFKLALSLRNIDMVLAIFSHYMTAKLAIAYQVGFVNFYLNLLEEAGETNAQIMEKITEYFGKQL